MLLTTALFAGLCLPLLSVSVQTHAQAAGETVASESAEPDMPAGEPSGEPIPGRILEARVEHGPAFGWRLGDRIEQHIIWPENEPAPDLEALSTVRRVSTWLERQRVDWQDEDATGERLLTIRYQIVNVPTSVQWAALPELYFTPETTDRTPLLVPAWPFTLGPLTPALVDTADAVSGRDTLDASSLLQPDTAAPVPDVRPLAEQRNRLAMLLMLTLLIWAAWYLWRTIRDTHRLPFAEAHHRLRRLRDLPPAARADQATEWQVLHQAFNRHAGRTIGRTDLPSLHADTPWLTSMKPQIDAFFAASEARHFELPARESDVELMSLCRSLRQLERQHRR